MLARDGEPADDSRIRRGVALGAAVGVALFAAGCVVIRLFAPARTVERLNAASMTPYRGAYLVSLPAQTYPGLLLPDIGRGPEDTATFLREDFQPLARVNWTSGITPAVGLGTYAIRDEFVIFRPKDGGDPRTPAHIVELGFPHRNGPLFYVLLASLCAWGGSVVLFFGRRRPGLLLSS
jgi:hypothetical protein